MTLVQRFFTAILPKDRAEQMRAESSSWLVKCECGYERSYWDLGGIRWKASGSPKLHRICPQCGRRNWHSVYRKPGPG
jgi:hypothetical protein